MSKKKMFDRALLLSKHVNDSLVNLICVVSTYEPIRILIKF